MPDEFGNYTIADRTVIKTAIANGLLEAKFTSPDGEREVRYRSMKDMKQALRDIEVELGMCPRRTRTTVTSSKGY